MRGRERILSKLRAGKRSVLATGHNEEVIAAAVDLSTSEKRKQQFELMLKASHAEIISCTPSSWNDELSKIVVSKQLYHWQCSNISHLCQSLESIQSAQPNLDMNIQVKSSRTDKAMKRDSFHNVQASLTEATAGLAETGSLVLTPGPHEPRTLSLIPPIHVVLFRYSSLLGQFSELIKLKQWQKNGLPTNVLLVSGPSKTADIQQTLAYGAHGPKELIILAIEDA